MRFGNYVDFTKLYNTLGTSLDYILDDFKKSVCVFDAPLYKRIPFYVFEDTIDENIVSIPVILDSIITPNIILYENVDYKIENGILIDISGKLNEIPVKFCPVVYYNDGFFFNKWGINYFKNFKINSETIQKLTKALVKFYVLGPTIKVLKEDLAEEFFGVNIEFKDHLIDPEWIYGVKIPKKLVGQDLVIKKEDPVSVEIYEKYLKHNLFGVFFEFFTDMENKYDILEAFKENIMKGRPINSYPIFIGQSEFNIPEPIFGRLMQEEAGISFELNITT